jgi:hypothetical protein
MRKVNDGFFGNTSRRKLFSFILILLFTIKMQAQCGPLTHPGLFGNSQTSVYCKNQPIEIGVFNSDAHQYYYFSVYKNGVETGRKGGPLDGNGSTLSVAAVMRSAQDAGEYRIRTYDDCGNADSTSYYAYYGAIDNLSILTWGNNNVKFNWAASGPISVLPNNYITYNYIITTRANPNLVSPDSILSTTDTFALVSNNSLVTGKTYYIHVRVDIDGIVKDGNPVSDVFSCSLNSNFDPIPLPWQTIKFTACSGTAPTPGTVTPAITTVCSSSTVTLTGNTGTTHKWYKDTTVISGAISINYDAPDSGQYRHFVTITGTTCQGMVATATVLKTSVQTSLFFGGGDFYSGDTVRLRIVHTVVGQTYKILKDGVEVYSFAGIGTAEFNSPDSVYYNFAITSVSQAGLYTVRTTSPYCSSSVDFGTAQVNLITGVTICPGASTSFTFSSAGNNTIFQWQVDAGSGFSPVTNVAGLYSGAATKTLNIINAPSTMYGYKYRCVATGGTPVTSSTRTLKFGVAWLGTMNTAWATATNWTCGVAPNANTDVIVQPTVSPVPSTNLPVISVSTSCKSVLVKPGATLKVNSGVTLTITGP